MMKLAFSNWNKNKIFRTISILMILTFTSTLLIGGCARPRPQPTTTTTTTAQPTSTSTTGQTTTTSTTTEQRTRITLYFIKEFELTMFLVREERTIPRTTATARAAVEELIKGPRKSDLFSAIPKQTRVRSVTISNGLATVDFSREVLNANVGAEEEMLGIYQIVNTLTEFPSIRRVRFTVEGKDRGVIAGRQIEDWWGHVGLRNQPFSRNFSLVQGEKIQTNTIRIERPRVYTEIDNPLRVQGRVQVFEATFQVRILDKNDRILADRQLMASDAIWGTFDASISYQEPEEKGRGTVLFYYFSPKDGSEVKLGSVPVFFK